MAWNFEVRYFSYGPSAKNAKIVQNWAISLEKHAVYTKFWKYMYTDIVTLVFLSRPSTEKKKNKKLSSTSIFCNFPF